MQNQKVNINNFNERKIGEFFKELSENEEQINKNGKSI